jgi:hypothetical protein
MQAKSRPFVLRRRKPTFMPKPVEGLSTQITDLTYSRPSDKLDIMTEDLQTNRAKSNPFLQRFMIYAGVLLIVFLLGFVPMWMKARSAANSQIETERQLMLVRMQSGLASAAIYARRGDYEPARQGVSQFFTSLQAEIAKGNASIYTQAQREAMQPLFAGRDEVITLLARSDPASADRISDLYVAYRKIVNT